jgi:hypothetical protein
VACYEAQVRMGTDTDVMKVEPRQVAPARWRAARVEQRACEEQQRKQCRFRYHCAQYLERLEAR